MSSARLKFKQRVPALLLLAATLAFWAGYARFKPDGPPLLDTPSIAQATWKQGTITEADGAITFQAGMPRKRPRMRFDLPRTAAHEWIRVQLDLKLDGTTRGEKHWQTVRVLFTQHRAGGERLKTLYIVLDETGTKAWKHHSKAFPMHPNTETVQLELQHLGPTGRALFKNLLVEPVQLRPSFTWWRIFFALAWIGTGWMYFRRCRLDTRPLRLLITLNACLILFGALMPSLWIDNSTSKIKTTLKARRVKAEKPAEPGERPAMTRPEKPPGTPPPYEQLIIHSHRTGHVVLFAGLCLLVFLSTALEKKRATHYLKIILDILLFAAITEALQLLTLDRTANLDDLVVDLIGIALALLLFLIVRPLLTRLSKGAPQEPRSSA